MDKIAVIADIFSIFFFFSIFLQTNYFMSGLQRDQKAFWGQNNTFFFLAGPAPFSYVSIGKDRVKPHRVKKQFPTS